ncbi:hypothetical protein G9A89_006094 [Geosiphon pyriformis]|nr:hypothetical protein G9A89_006094 [Geosiphon pyriformis]
MALAVKDKQSWVFRDQHKALLYTLPVGTTVHDLSGLLDSYGEKTCLIGCNPSSYVCDRCAVVCLADEESKLAVIGSIPISGIRGKWMVTDQDQVCLASIYKKKHASIAHSVFFGDRTWAQVAGSLSSHVASSVFFGTSLFLVAEISLFASALSGNCDIYSCLAFLERFLELLADQVSGILEKLGSINLVLLANTSDAYSLAVPVFVVSGLDLNMVLNDALAIPNSSTPVISNTALIISPSSSKVLTTKIGGLESKMVALEILVESKIAMCNVRGMNNSMKQEDIIHWHKETNNFIFIFDGIWVFTSGLNSGHVGSGVVIVMDISLAKHVCKVSEMPGGLLSIKLLFKNKLSVSILGLYAGASSTVQFSQADKVNFLIAKAVNKSFFVVLDGNFNENGLHKSVSFKRCLDLGLVNSLSGSPVVKSSTWKNSKGVKKTIDFVLVSFNLVNAVVDHNVVDVSKHFNTNHWAVSVSVSLGVRLIEIVGSLILGKSFKDATSVNADMFANEFEAANVLCKIMTLSANEIFRKKWFKDFDGVFIRDSLRFHKLELLVSKLVKAFHLVSNVEFASLLDMWCGIDTDSAAVIKSLFLLGSNFDTICLALIKVRKSYHFSKLLEFRHAEKVCIKAAINKKIESFESDKDYTIRSVLECSFYKVVLDYLVVGNELVLEPILVKSRKCRVMPDISDKWSCQYRPLEYVFNDAFSSVMCPVGIDKLLGVVSNLSENKAAGLSGISNELWKHCNKSVLDMLLVLLNSCLICESVSSAWKEAWDRVLTNIQPIVLIETACKILFKILLNRILSACSIFDVLRGDNFSVLRGTTMQSPIFAIGSVVEDALEKGYKLWLVLQDMWKAYDSVGQADGCGYRLNFYFISECGRAKFWAGLSSFFAVSAFVDDTIWIGSSQSATQYILNIASEFFDINNISINNNKTVAILINCKVADSFLLISELSIFIAKKEELHYYLEIYLSTEGFFKPSLAKEHSDVRFFANLVLKKTVSDKQFLYLVSAVLFPIIGYRTQFSYVLVSAYKNSASFLSVYFLSLDDDGSSNILHSYGFSTISANLLCSDIGHFSVYMDRFLSGLESVNIKAGTAVFFEDIGMSLGVRISGLMSSILTELQAIVLAFECVSFFCSIDLFLDSQVALNACKLELDLVCPDFRNWCWIEHRHIVNVIRHKNLNINWYKVKNYSGVLGNKHVDELARAAALSSWNLSHFINEHYFRIDGAAISGNFRHFVDNVFQSVYCTYWEIGSGSWMVVDSLCADIDWFRLSLVWHPDSHMAAGFTSKRTAGF